MPLPKAIDRHLTGEFHEGLCSSLFSNCGECCFYWCCGPCAVYSQRQRLLKLTKEPYVCCAGLFPFGGCDKPRSDGWLFAEAWCCGGAAQAGNRFMVQTRLNRKNTGVDDCLRCTHCCLHIEFAVCFKPICGCTKEQESLCKAGACALPCYHCQNGVEIEMMEKALFSGNALLGGSSIVPPPGVIEELPNHFAHIGLYVAQAPPQQTMP